MIGTIIAIIVAAGFGYFVYTRIQASKGNKPGSGGGSGGGSGKNRSKQK